MYPKRTEPPNTNPLLPDPPVRTPLYPEGYKTFDQWSREGFRIMKGATSRHRSCGGVPLFHENQVHKPTPHSTRHYSRNTRVRDTCNPGWDDLAMDGPPNAGGEMGMYYGM